LNLRPTTTEPGGWIGSPVVSGSLTYLEHHTPWVYVLKDPTRAHQPIPSQPDYNPYTSRYAYWIQDESSKVDYAVAGNKEGSSGEFVRGDNPRLPQDIDLGALPLNNLAPLVVGAASGTANTQLQDFFRSPAGGVFDFSLINRASSVLGTNLYQNIKYYGTIRSLSNELSNFGTRRTNLNALVTNVNAGDPRAANKIAADLDDIIYAITGSHAGLTTTFNASDDTLFSSLGNQSTAASPMPNFGTRFYTGTVTSAHRLIYLRKLAANIRDYIDTDSQPTFVNAGRIVNYGTKPLTSWLSGSEPQAIGKEAIPYFHEHMWRAKETNWTRISTSTIQYTLEFYHYFEFFNPSTKDWTAPAGTYLRVYNQPTWEAGSFASIRPGDFELDLSGEVFPAGKATVITTDPSPPTGMISPQGKTITRSITTALYRFSGRSDLSATVGGATVRGVVRLNGRNSQYTDYQSEMVFGLPTGYLSAFPFLTISASSRVWAHSGIYLNSDSSIFFGSSLRGNDEVDRSGDPQTLSEQLASRGGSASLDGNLGTQTRFYGGVQRDLLPDDHSLGRAAISYVDPTGTASNTKPWPDYNRVFNDTPETAFSFVRDSPMTSIGELGNVYDPARTPSPTLPTAERAIYARGGGRTLKIGQADDLSGTTRYSATWNNGAWRLCELFSADSNTTNSASQSTVVGKININGVLRDDGIAMRALLRSLNFAASPNSDPALNGNFLPDSEIDAIITSIKAYLTTNGPMMERGELSLISYFNRTTSPQPRLGGISFSLLNDRGREEVFRKMIELITTRSASFSVYVVADAINESAVGLITRTARHRLRTGFFIRPQITDVPFDKVTGYKVEIAHESP
jgi:hypothetical protein